MASEKDSTELPWEKGYLNIGYYFATLSSSIRLGEGNLGIGFDLNVEDTLGLDDTGGSFRADGGWRFTKNKRHKLELGWFSFHRSGSKYLDEVIEIPPELGGGTLGPGTYNSTFDFDIIKAKYEYSFLLDDRVDFNIGLGLFIMPFEIGILVDAGGTNGKSGEVYESVTAPLPVVSIGFDVVMTPKWYVRQQTDIFYLEIDGYRGGIADVQIALEYLPWKNFGFGLGLDSLHIQVEGNGESDVPGVDSKGNIDFDTTGIHLYLKAFF
jgi:hypothetical protein